MCCGGAPTVSALGSLGTARAARLGRPRPHGDPRSLWEIHISPSLVRSLARALVVPRAPYRANRVPTRSAAPPQHAPDTEKINPGHLVVHLST